VEAASAVTVRKRLVLFKFNISRPFNLSLTDPGSAVGVVVCDIVPSAGPPSDRRATASFAN
jgi:hypothetical protein